jgi:hypothetical protein
MQTRESPTTRLRAIVSNRSTAKNRQIYLLKSRCYHFDGYVFGQAVVKYIFSYIFQ